jgi:hypothetical protein
MSRPTSTAAAAAALLIGVVMLAACKDDKPDGWTHECTLTCVNQQTHQQEKITRLGRNVGGDPVCKEIKPVCDAGRSAACVNAANWTNAHEPLYKECEAVAFGECTRSCKIER